MIDLLNSINSLYKATGKTMFCDLSRYTNPTETSSLQGSHHLLLLAISTRGILIGMLRLAPRSKTVVKSRLWSRIRIQNALLRLV